MKYIKHFEAKKENDPFVQAAKRGNNNKIKEFIKNGVDINTRNYDDKKTALMEACLNRFLLVAKTLLEAGADPNLQDRYDRTALMMSSTNKITDLLLEHGADVNIQNINYETAIVEYLDFGMGSEQLISLIEKFSKYGLDLDIKNNRNHNFYEKLIIEKPGNRQGYNYDELINYMNTHYPQYRESAIIQKYEFDRDINKYNL